MNRIIFIVNFMKIFCLKNSSHSHRLHVKIEKLEITPKILWIFFYLLFWIDFQCNKHIFTYFHIKMQNVFWVDKCDSFAYLSHEYWYGFFCQDEVIVNDPFEELTTFDAAKINLYQNFGSKISPYLNIM